MPVLSMRLDLEMEGYYKHAINIWNEVFRKYIMVKRCLYQKKKSHHSI